MVRRLPGGMTPRVQALRERRDDPRDQQDQGAAVSAEDLRAAQRHPERYRNLMVRVGGFSAFFVELDPAYQEDMLQRTEHTV